MRTTKDTVQSRGESLGEGDERSVVDLLIDQIEFCDVLVLNKLTLSVKRKRKTDGDFTFA